MVYADLPATVRTALAASVAALRKGTPRQEYRHVTRQSGRRNASGERPDRGWQVQRKSNGVTIRYPIVAEPVLGAFMVAAAAADPRLRSMHSMAAWLLWLLRDPQNAADWWAGRNA